MDFDLWMYKPNFAIQDLFVMGQESLKISSYFDQLYTSVYLGFGALLLSFAGFFVKQARFFFDDDVDFLRFCVLGPRIFWSASEYVTYSWLYHFVTLATPYMSGLDEPFEFVVIASFFSTVSVGIVLQHIWQTSKKIAVTIGFLLLSLHFYGSPAPMPVQIARVPYHKFYIQQATAEHQYSILDFPPKRQGNSTISWGIFLFPKHTPKTDSTCSRCRLVTRRFSLDGIVGCPSRT